MKFFNYNMSFLEDCDHLLKVQMKDILSATNNFDPATMIGVGDLGRVYKGELSLLEGPIMVAFKRLDRVLGQGSTELWKELAMQSKLKHENLISLMCYCIEGDEMILGYKYASRGNLDRYLSDASLTWTDRLKICLGVARGLDYLLDLEGTKEVVIHRDIKSQNILLDENWIAKVSDFGLSQVGPAKQAQTFVVSDVVGTSGYCDPLYMKTDYLSKESDVYSFGVVLFEVLCGRLCCEYKGNLTNYFVPKWRQCYEENTLDEIIFPALKEQMDPGSLNAFSAIAYQCIKKGREERPMMDEVVKKLEFALQLQDIFEDLGKKVDKETLIKIAGMSKEVDWERDEIIILKEDYDLSQLPNSPHCKNLLKLSIQIPSFTEIPPAFFEHMPLLEELDLSTTNIQSLPSSISYLTLLRKLFLKDCSVLMELPYEIRMLTKLKLLDCEGSEIMYIPKEIGELNDLEVLRVTLSPYADKILETNHVKGFAKISKKILSSLKKLRELCLTTCPEAEWWEEEVGEIQNDLCHLEYLETLKWYLPTKMVLDKFLQIERDGKRIYENLSNFTLTIGRHPQLTSCLPVNLEKKFEKFEKCLKWINAEGNEKEISMIMEWAEALLLSHHWTIVRLSDFDLAKLKYCLLAECNEMESLVEVDELSQDVENVGKVGLESIEYLAVYNMEKFQTIWKGPVGKDSLSKLRILALHRCWNLTTIFNISIAQSLSRLTELIVEDCPNVRSLISAEIFNMATGPLIPCLEKIFLLYLPQLDSISRGKIILEKVDILFVCSCPKLECLYVTELPNIQKIKGEKEWWNDLKCDKSRWQNVFEPLEEEEDISLFDQLAEATNSLQHFDYILMREAKDEKPLDRSSLGMSEKGHTTNVHIEEQGLSLSKPDAKDDKPLDRSSLEMSENKGHTSNFHIEEQGLSMSQTDPKDDKPLERSSLEVSGTKDHTSNLSMKRFPVAFRFHPTDIELVRDYLKRKLLGEKNTLKAVAEVNIYDFSPWDLPDKCSLRSGNLWFFFVPKAKKYSIASRYKRATETGFWKATGKDREVKYEERILAAKKRFVFYQWKAGFVERTNWVMHEYKMKDEQLANAGITQDMYMLCKVFEKSGSVSKHDAQYDTRFYEEDWNDDIEEPGSSAVIYSENEAINTPTCKKKSLATMDMTVSVPELDAKDEMPFDHCSLGVSETKGHSSNFTIGEQEGLFLSQPDAKYEKPLERSSLEVSETKGNASNFPSGEQEGLSLSLLDAKDEKLLVPSSFGMSGTKGQSSNFSIGESEGLSLSPPVNVMEGRISEAPAIGIDLGTTYSCVAVWNRNRIEIIPNDQGNRTTPSCVAFIDAERLIGDGAKNQTTTRPASTIFDAKRLIGRKFSDLKVQAAMKLWPFKVIEGPVDTPKIVVTYNGQEKEFLAEEISSMILGKMKEIAEAYLGKDVKNAVITVPACFNDSQRQATMDAGTIAGLNIIRMINEPTAAAIAYGLDYKSDVTKKINVLIFDLGGGTFDVSLSTIEEGGNFKVKGVAGDTHLGGEDFDNRMVDYCVREFKRRFSKDLLENQRALGRLKVACEKAKRILSSTTQTSIELDCLHDGMDFSMRFTRAKFEELNMSLFNICIKTLEKCLSDAKMEKSLVDEIILVGGSTRIPKIQLMLREFFDGKELSKSLNPDEAVAYGAAVMAKTLSDIGVRSFRDFSLLDVTPLSLGIGVIGNLFSIVIPRNTPIPTKKGKNYYTTVDNQTSMIMQVYQGERPQSTKNNLLGEFKIHGIPLAPKGVSKIKVYFEIDINGILTVMAKQVSFGRSKKLTVTRKNSRLSKDEIEKMVKDAEEYKNEDRAYKKKVDAYNALEDYLYNMKNKIKKRDIKMVNPETLKKIENSIADTTKWLEDNRGAPLEELQWMKVSLELVCAPLF